MWVSAVNHQTVENREELSFVYNVQCLQCLQWKFQLFYFESERICQMNKKKTIFFSQESLFNWNWTCKMIMNVMPFALWPFENERCLHSFILKIESTKMELVKCWWRLATNTICKYVTGHSAGEKLKIKSIERKSKKVEIMNKNWSQTVHHFIGSIQRLIC